MNLSEIMASGCTVVDVRSREEFRHGHVPGAVNIPLSEVIARRQEIESLSPPLVICCASGNRSEAATRWISAIGIHCVNGGTWTEVHQCQSKIKRT